MSENIKNMILAAALSLVFIGLWDYFYAFPEIDKQRRAQTQQEQLAKVPQLGAPEQKTAAAAPPVKVAPKTRAEALALSPRIAIDTRSISGSIALKGGRIDDVSLKNYRETVDPSSPIITLLSPEDGPSPYYAELGYLTAETENAPVLPTTETLWTTDADVLTTAKPVTLTWDNGRGLVFKRVISVDDEYLFTVKDSVENKAANPVTLFNYARVSRVGHPPSAGYAALHEGFVGVVGDAGQEVTYDKIEKEDNAVTTYKGVGGWVGLTDKYWAAVVAPDQNLPMEARYASMGGAVKTYQADTVSDQKTIEPGKLAETTTYVFAGAKVVDVLDAYKANPGLKRFDLLIDWGWFYFITRPMFRLIDFLYKLLGNFGLAILAVTVIVKLAFLPLANKSYQSIAKMKAIQPRIKELKEKYGDDKHKFNMEQMELFKREKVNPASGCLPVIVQIPVFFSLYKVLVVTIEMRHAPFFGWIRDLSAPDPTNVFNLFGVLPFDPTHVAIFGPYLALGVWPLLMGVSMWLQMKMNPEPADEIQKTMFAWMPVIFTFTMGGFASGLLIYWTWNNLLSIVQQGVIMKRAGVKFEFWDNLRKTFQRA
ncbi:membrane protein insertase YidC [Methylocystis suflitae]|uniref:membrane protein insertase YidC n=2 Tax=Methylocystis TaxID=133 RepID=UPI00210CE736|nr:membrane protein insertase YidC [Methylocystis suflitae]MCQ4190427.1 membrane protein insertase YidC [Methylocystis suflitae]